MAQATALTLSISGANVVYTVAGIQNGDLPTIWETVPAGGVIDYADTISHRVTGGSANRTINLKLVNKITATEGVVRALGCEIKFTFPKNSTTVEREKMIDAVYSLLSLQKANIASTQTYF